MKMRNAKRRKAVPPPLTAEGFEQVRHAWADKDLPCGEPACDRRVSFRAERSGLQRVFCSDACRVKFARTRDRLISDWGRIEHSKNALQAPADARAISQEQRRIEWLLKAYGVEEIPREVVNPLSHPMPIILWHGPEDFARFAEAVHEWEDYFVSRKPSEDFLSMLDIYERTRRDPHWTGEPDARA